MRSPLFKRVIFAGLTGFYRNRTVSLSSVFILTITLLIISSFYFFRATFDYTLDQIKEKVDVRIYFNTDATEKEITDARARILGLPQVRSVVYLSREQALEEFKASHGGDQLTLQALDELGDNPFGASLSILAKDPTQYEAIAQELQGNTKVLGESQSAVDKINYYQLKGSIEKLNAIIGWVNTVGLTLSVVFVLMSCMIVYNTVRLAIFVFRDEIAVMKLVGASNMYIRGPFIVEATLYSVVATFVTLLLLWPASIWLTRKTLIFFDGMNFYSYYLQHLLELGGLLLGFGILLSVVSSLLAVRKYLKV